MGLIKKFISRKLLVAIAGMFLTWLTSLGLPPEVAGEVAAMLATMASVYILGQSWVDGRVKPEDLKK
jgi:hypothetical protein